MNDSSCPQSINHIIVMCFLFHTTRLTGAYNNPHFCCDVLRRYRTGYLKHVKGYTSPRQSRADIKVGEEGADGVNLEGKVIVITG
eukprot:scaffold74257_cov42-Attheya_sp.AAC.1